MTYDPDKLLGECEALLDDPFTLETDFENRLAVAFKDLWSNHYLPAHDRANVAELRVRQMEPLLREAFASPMIEWEWYDAAPDLQVQDDDSVPAQLTYGWLRAARKVLADIGDEEEGR